ncbi:MAG: sulfatase-like hydrolase/transferase [Polyangiales bacterium]
MRIRAWYTTRLVDRKRAIWRSLVTTAIVALLSVYSGCSITRVKWRIKPDRELAHGKKEFLNALAEGNANVRPPNIIVLLADDLGKYEVSAYGAEHISTPNIDQIGAEGVVFEEGYVTSPTCAPSRAGLMTGRVQNRYGLKRRSWSTTPPTGSNTFRKMVGRYGFVSCQGKAFISGGMASCAAGRSSV